jgi:capsule polysaccharide export protein KpsE/RkpR
LETEKDSKVIQEAPKPLTLLDIILIILKWKKQIIISTSIICIISIILYFFVFDLIYLSSASIKSTSKSSGLLSSIEGLPDIGALGDIGLGGSQSAKELAAYEDILNSRRCIEPLIDKFDLMNRDDYLYKEDAISTFSKSKLILNEDKTAGILTIGVYDKNSKLAKEMVEFLLLELDKINIELNVQNARNNREFVEKRYFQAKEDLSKAEDSLKSFQMIYGVAPDLQIKAAAQSAFALEAELKTEEVKLDVLKKILSPDQIEVKTQEAKLNALKDKITEIQNSTDLNDFMRLGNSPQIAMSFLRLEREVEIQSKILTYLLPVYEQAKIEEKKETPTIIVLDKPYVAERKSKPKRLTMVVVWTFIGFVSVNLYYVLKSRWKMWKQQVLIAKSLR